MVSPELTELNRIVQSQINKLGRVQKELLGNYRPVAEWDAPNMDEIDRMWHTFDRITRKYWWLSLTMEEYCDHSKPEFPGWDALGI